MKIKFLKKVKNKETEDFFEVGKSYELTKERAEFAIKKGFAEKIVERKKPKSKKLQEQTIKK